MTTKIVLAILMLAAVILPATAQVTTDKVEIRGEIAQLISGSNFDIKEWNATNFAGFWYDIDDNTQTESLNIVKFKDNRTIEKKDLIYTATRAAQRYKVFKEKGNNLTIEHGLDKNLNKPSSPSRGGYYALVGWMAEKYIAVNGKNNKLAKLILEQGTSDKQTLQVGGSWELGDGYTLTAQSIDAKASPRQAWLVLSKDGKKLDDKVVEQGSVYTYSMKSLSGETDVPIFVTYADSVFAGQTSDMVQLKYTWVISTQVMEIKSSDKFGVFEVDSEQPLRLRNTASVSLSRDSTINLAGNMKFKVADSAEDDVRFYPKIDYEIGNVTTPTTNETTPATPVVNQTTAIANRTGIATPPPTEGVETPTKTVTTATEKKPTPGFEVIVAIVGLISVIYLVFRRKK